MATVWQLLLNLVYIILYTLTFSFPNLIPLCFTLFSYSLDLSVISHRILYSCHLLEILSFLGVSVLFSYLYLWIFHSISAFNILLKLKFFSSSSESLSEKYLMSMLLFSRFFWNKGLDVGLYHYQWYFLSNLILKTMKNYIKTTITF